MIEDGRADNVSLDGLKVALATRYHDDEPGSPWSFVLYLDVRADAAQREALEGIYTGRLGGDALRALPVGVEGGERLAVRPVEIEVSHEPRRQWLRIHDHVSVRIRDAWAGPETVTCVIPGHEQERRGVDRRRATRRRRRRCASSSTATAATRRASTTPGDLASFAGR